MRYSEIDVDYKVKANDINKYSIYGASQGHFKISLLQLQTTEAIHIIIRFKATSRVLMSNCFLAKLPRCLRK